MKPTSQNPALKHGIGHLALLSVLCTQTWCLGGGGVDSKRASRLCVLSVAPWCLGSSVIASRTETEVLGKGTG